MAICEFCNQEMSDDQTISCNNESIVFPAREQRQPIPYALSMDGIQTAVRCHDCNVMHGGIHHHGCDMEVCPKCDNQLITCGCLEPTATREKSNKEKKTARIIEKAVRSLRAVLDSFSYDALISTDPIYTSIHRDLHAALQGIEDLRNIIDDDHLNAE